MSWKGAKMGLQLSSWYLQRRALKTVPGIKYQIEYLVPLTTGIADDAHIPGFFSRKAERSYIQVINSRNFPLGW